jgi:outer membrane protein OmpA-like peptidoglycan-associated protein
MAQPSRKVAGRLVAALLVGGLVWPLTSGPAVAQQVKADQIIEALTPPPITRGLGAPAQPAMSESDRAFIEGLRHRTRSLSLTERERVATITKNSPNINLEIYFDYDSAEITAKAEPQLAEIAEALRKGAQLRDAVMLLSGHTDGRGGDDYNHQLSERRAEAVKKHLSQKYQIPAENLTTAGWGKQKLKNKDDQFAAENRRVQIVTVVPSSEAKR